MFLFNKLNDAYKGTCVKHKPTKKAVYIYDGVEAANIAIYLISLSNELKGLLNSQYRFSLSKYFMFL